MFSIFQKKDRTPPEPEIINIPDWASFFTQEEYTAFLAGLESYFRGMDVTFTLDEGTIEADPEVLPFSQLGLHNIAQVCKQHAIEEYAERINVHFTTMLKALEFDKTFDNNIIDFEKVKPYLAVRLYNEEYMTYIGSLDGEDETTVHRFVADDVHAMLVFDLPDAIRNVQPSHVLDWNKDEDDLFSIALANVRENYPMHVTREDMGGFTVWFANNDHFFTGNIVYELEDRPELLGSKGALIAIPHRHSALIYPIEDLGVVTAIQKMIPAAYSMHEEGPGSLTPNLFWYHNGIFIHLPYEVQEEKLHFIPPDSFMEMLNQFESTRH